MVIAGGASDESLDVLADRIVGRHSADQPQALVAAMSEFREATGASLLDARDAIQRAFARRARIVEDTRD
jgi:hypothetical protein